jgi:hypothetical protein
MKTCKTYNCKNTELVYSGIDSVVLGVMPDIYCYDCSNIYAQIKRDMNSLVKN